MEIIVERQGLSDEVVRAPEVCSYARLLLAARVQLDLEPEYEFEFEVDGAAQEADDTPLGAEVLDQFRVAIAPKLRYVARNRLLALGCDTTLQADVNRAVRLGGQDLVTLLVCAEVLPRDYLANFVADASEREEEACIQLVRGGFDVHACDDEGASPLFWAATNGLRALAAELLAHGAALEHANEDGDTPLCAAVWCNRGALVTELLAAGANIHHANEDGATPLLLALGNEMPATATELIGHGADIHHANDLGETPLMLCAKRNSLSDVMTHLLKLGADVAAAADDGSSVLMYAAREGVEGLCRELLAAGADARHANREGECAWDWAVAQDHMHLEAALKVA
eukprot:TRINITY_DN27180_c0_g1_i1.p1 TRINITY_DN27180_c0_g1~~TRINITY_DN27180_c0_g1_i1.p1  ORF type:complete len:342 (+),score=165.61 TRINITY_DN27180_c0_g1_i1:93-1118(+)